MVSLRKACLLLSWVAWAGLALSVGACEDVRDIHQAVPDLDTHYLGNTEVAPGPEQYSATPDSNELAIDFGLTDVDTNARRYLFFRNSGEGALHLTSVDLVAGSSADFSVACLDNGQFRVGCPYAEEPLVVAPGQDLVVRVTYAPRDVGPDSGSFVIGSDAYDRNQITVTLLGEGVTPEVQVCVSDCSGDQAGADCAGAALVCNDAVAPASLSLPFGDLDMTASAGRDVLIRNQGDRPLNINALAFISGAHSQFRVQAGDVALPGVLPAGQETTVRVTYDPSMGGEHIATMQVLSNDVNEREINIVASGRGLAPRVCPEPMALDFGNVPTGQSLEQSFTITNCGMLQLDLLSLALQASSSLDFSLVVNPAPVSLQPGELTTVTVRYAPMAEGSDRGDVDIFSNDPVSNPQTHRTGSISLHGESIPRQCQLYAAPPAVQFGGVVQQESDTINLVVTNLGTDTCTLQRAEITANSADDEFSLTQTPPQDSEILPGDSVSMVVQYAPVNLGVDTGVLTLYGNDADGAEIDVDLNGEGIQSAVCDLVVLPDSANFGTVKVNNTAAQVIQLTNDGQGECRITQLELKHSMMFPGNFSITGVTNGAGSLNVPFTIARRNQPNSQVEVEITYAPTTASDEVLQQSATLRLTSDDPDLQLIGGSVWGTFPCSFPPVELGQACVPVSGISAESAIEVVPAELDFGVVLVGCYSPELHVTVYNLGTEPLVIERLSLETEPDPNFEIRSAPPLPYTLNGGGSFQVRLAFHPEDDRVHRNNLIIESDASNAEFLAVPLFGRGTLESTQTDTFFQPTEVLSDVLFVVDNSGSMGWAQSALAQNFASFIQYATSLDVDYHIGVIATEVFDPETNMGDPPRDIIPGVLVQAPGRPKIITNQTPNLNQAFADNVNLGTCCSDEQESGLQAAHMALTEPLVSDLQANDGFLREDAKLYIICLSDEQDQSRGDPDFYVDFFQSIKGFRNPEMMKVSAIVGDAPDGCPDPTNPTAGSGSRYIEVANRTGGIFESICTQDWSQSLQNLGIDAFAAIREFPLSRPADPGSLEVCVSSPPTCEPGDEVPPCPQASPGCADGYTYYPDTNSIYFGDNVVPQRGEVIVAGYDTLCNP